MTVELSKNSGQISVITAANSVVVMIKELGPERARRTAFGGTVYNCLGVCDIMDTRNGPVFYAQIFMNNFDNRYKAIDCTRGSDYDLLLIRVINRVIHTINDICGRPFFRSAKTTTSCTLASK